MNKNNSFLRKDFEGKMYLKQLYNGQLKYEFGKNAKELSEDEKFNVWEAYSYLKRINGFYDWHFEQEDFDFMILMMNELLHYPLKDMEKAYELENILKIGCKQMKKAMENK